MQKLYSENQYIREFNAEIVNVIDKNGEFHIELDNTYFCPENEHHFYDIGYINGAPVSYVYENDEKIYHVTNVKPIKIHRVKCSIDWQKRYNYMQHCLGQHIICDYLTKLFNANILKIHLDNSYSYIDIDKSIEEIQSIEVEKSINSLICNNIKIETMYPTKAELKKLPINKSYLKTNKQIRVLKIDDLYLCECNGIYPHSTIEMQIMKINKLEKLKIGTRIYFICGLMAVNDCFLKDSWIKEISSKLHCSNANLLTKVEGLSNELKSALSENTNLKSKVAEYEIQNMLNSCENIKDVRIIKSIYDGVNLKYTNLLASKLVSASKVIVLFGVKCEDKAQLIFMCSKDLKIISMGSLLKDAISLIDGNGGGNAFSAQGGGKNNNNLDSSIEYAYNKVKDSISK